jgi:hypothetical protein
MPDIESREEDEEIYPFGPFFGFFMLGMHLAEAIDALKKWIRGEGKL